MERMLERIDPDSPGIGSLPHWIDPEELGRSHASGSGVVVSGDGHIVTNHHLFTDVISPEIEVHLFDGRAYSGDQVELVASDRLTDLAVIRVKSGGFHPIRFGDSDRLNIGDWVLAIGNPLDLDNTVTQGIISSKYRDTGQGILVDFIQSSAHIEPGSSGGALMNVDGELVGINTAIATTQANWEGFGFALPSNTVREVVEALIETGHVPRGFIGIEFLSDQQSLPEPMRRLLGYVGPGGVLVRRVTDDGPADLSGIRSQDIIISVASQPVASGIDLLRAVAALQVGTTTEVEIWRGDPENGEGRQMSMDLMIAPRPTDQEILAMNSIPGVTPPPREPEITELGGTGLALEFRPWRRNGAVRVATVEPDSPAEAAGFQIGDRILGVNGTRIFSPLALFAAIRLQGPGVENHTFFVERPDGAQSHLLISDSQ
jgi:serine protease Do